MTQRIIEDKRPSNIEHAPNFLSQVQAATALGLSLHLLHRMEKDDPSFPKRQALPFTKQTKFRRDDLIEWYQATRQHQTELSA